MAFIGRIIVICLRPHAGERWPAGIAIAFGMLGPEWHGFGGDFAERTGFWLLVFFGAGFTGAIGLLPLAILIAIAEGFKIRSLLAYAAVGAALAGFRLLQQRAVASLRGIDRPSAAADLARDRDCRGRRRRVRRSSIG